MCSHMTCSNVSVMLSIYYSLNIYLLHPSSTLLPYTTLFRSLRALSALGVPFARQRPGRYAQQLRRALRSCDPGRKLDLLLAAALIEARSAERFQLLAARVPAPLARLYQELGASEARHFEVYTGLACGVAPAEWRSRLGVLAAREAELVTTPDRMLRFHSGPLHVRLTAT